MKVFILFFVLISFCGCEEPSINDSRYFLLDDFKQITKYSNFTDDNYETGHFNYWFYKKDNFLNVSISGISDKKIIEGALEEFKSVMRKRNIEMPIEVYIYKRTIRKSKTRSTSEGLIKKYKIN